jgi:hypothetical protein
MSRGRHPQSGVSPADELPKEGFKGGQRNVPPFQLAVALDILRYWL